MPEYLAIIMFVEILKVQHVVYLKIIIMRYYKIGLYIILFKFCNRFGATKNRGIFLN